MPTLVTEAMCSILLLASNSKLAHHASLKQTFTNLKLAERPPKIQNTHLHGPHFYPNNLHRHNPDNLPFLPTLPPLLANQPRPRELVPSRRLQAHPLGILRVQRIHRRVPAHDPDTNAVEEQSEDVQEGSRDDGAECGDAGCGVCDAEEYLCHRCK